MAEQNQVIMEARQGEAVVLRVPLAGAKMVIGRSQDVPICLPGLTVSRQHAEVFADPFGRWWIKDLGSRNGTRVNGTVIADDTLLKAGDRIEIEEFVLSLAGAVPVAERPRRADAGSGVTLGDSPAQGISSLRDLKPKIDATHLSKLTEFAAALLATEDDAERQRMMCQLMLAKHFHGQSAVILRLSKQNADEPPETVFGPETATNWRAGEMPYVSRTLLRAVRQSNAPVVASNVSGGSPAANGQNVVQMSLAGAVRTMAAVACPLGGTETTLDILYVSFPAEYGNGEWLALASLACEQFQQSNISWVARRQAQAQAIMEKELEQARNIQMRLVPKKVDAPGLDVAIGFEPCHWVGGDYVDAVPTGDGRIFLAVADVCGKGMQAALITASLHTMVHTNIRRGVALSEVMDRLNDYLCQTLPDESFVTMVGIMLDTRSGVMECANAGHPPVIIVARGGAVRQLGAGMNPPLGCMPVPIEMETAQLNSGDMMAMYTDGLSEMTGDVQTEMLGIEGVSGMLAKLYTKSTAGAGPLAAGFRGMLDQYLGKAMPQDDRTFMLLCRA